MAELDGNRRTQTYEEELKKQADNLHRLRLQRGAPTYRMIEARARKLFGASLPLSTQSTIFKGGYASMDKLMPLVRTLYSWDEYGDECRPPDRKADVLTKWREHWAVITDLRRITQRRQAGSTDPSPERSEDEFASVEEDGTPQPMSRRSHAEATPSTVMAFKESIRHPDRPSRVILFADIGESMEMKIRLGEVSWLQIFDKFTEIVMEAITAQGGTVIKYLSDGALAAFETRHASQAINSAIRIQEMLHVESMRGVLTEECHATIGIATGRVVEYRAPGGGLDYAGFTVDRAARLSLAGAPKAIYIDTGTLVSANMSAVTSTMGQALEYDPSDYLTVEAKVSLKGFPDPIRYREVIWHKYPFGVKNHPA
ncbi:adenylate/guanylate cyclase domain-containing protein [Streptomyces mutabilis]|uniref:adenylate/guanylate cyclase domain-containing protein n=1 Tax=Streptomyces mutabilis TaxID=67332 RepID=UPI00365F094A